MRNSAQLEVSTPITKQEVMRNSAQLQQSPIIKPFQNTDNDILSKIECFKCKKTGHFPS